MFEELLETRSTILTVVEKEKLPVDDIQLTLPVNQKVVLVDLRKLHNNLLFVVDQQIKLEVENNRG
jgi:predicted transcriptional regulator